MITILGIYRMVRWVNPKYDFVQAMEEMEEYMALEYDFTNEGRYADEFRRAFEVAFPNRAVIVPRVIWEVTSPQVLVAEYFSGASRVDDVSAIRTLGLKPDDVGKLVVSSMSYAMFVKGLVHADPHGGNILVRPHPENSRKPQIAVLDFGLAAKLHEDLRIDVARLYTACALHHDDALEQLAPKFGLKNSTQHERSVLASCTIQEPYDLFSLLANHTFTHDRNGAREYWDKEAEIISAVFRDCPKEFTLAVTNLDTTRSLHMDLGATFNRVLETCRWSEQAIANAEKRWWSWRTTLGRGRRWVESKVLSWVRPRDADDMHIRQLAK